MPTSSRAITLFCCLLAAFVGACARAEKTASVALIQQVPLAAAVSSAARTGTSASPQTPARNGQGGAGVHTGAAKLKLATWNLEWLNGKEGHGTVRRDTTDYARLRRYADRLDADIVAFQEVDGERAAARVFSPDRYAFHVAAQNTPQRTGFAYKKYLKVTKKPDYSALDVGGLRFGADIAVDFGAKQLRLLSVHLKSGCFEEPLTKPSRPCRKLSEQLPALEAWIDARAMEGVPFALLGDFNRRFFARPDEPFWTEIDDADPPEADLASPTQGSTAACWNSAFPHFIDHLVLSRSAVLLLERGSFVQHVYDATDRSHKRVLSEHCPLSIILTLSAARAATASPRAQRAPEPPRHASLPTDPPLIPERLPIKGNISARGQRIYHLPNCPNYADTRIAPNRGERLFETEHAARTAGWRKAKNCP